MDISTAADKAADYIVEHGHEKYVFENQVTGAVCIRGALNAVTGLHAFDCTEGDKIGVVVAKYLGFDSPYAAGKELPMWNNEEERTEEEVIDVLRNVAIKYRSDAMTIESDGR